MTLLHWTLPLPTGYRRDDVITFHSRDGEAVAEQVTPTGLRKGILVQGVPVVLDVAFTDTEAVCRAEIDGDNDLQTPLHGALLNILGLRIDPQPFAQLAAGDPLLAPLVSLNPGLRIVQSASPFEALTWAIIGQQINLPFAFQLKRRLIERTSPPFAENLHAPPTPAAIAALTYDDLKPLQFSRSKATYLIDTARLVAGGQLDLEALRTMSATRAERTLLALRGLGPWSVNYLMMRSLAFADCVPLGDTGVTSGLHALLKLDERPDIEATKRLMSVFSPYRSLATAHLWQFNQPAP